MRSLLPIAISLLLLPAVLLADDWPTFRGPGSRGASPAKGLPTTWDDKTNTNITWKVPIHDKGWSSPVILGKQIWLTTAQEDGKEQWAVCLDRDTGKIIHDVKVFDTPKPPYFFMKDYNSHASPTPVLEPGKAYVHFGSAGTACIDSESGKILWSRRDLPCNHWRAPASSPIIWEDLLILTFDGYDQQYVTALYKATGKTAWRTDRSLDYKTDDGDRKKGYSTPAVITVDGKPQLVSPAAVGAVAYEPRTGKEIWKVYYGGMNAGAPPQYGHGLVFMTTGSPNKLIAVPPTGTGDLTAKIRWSLQKETPSRSCPVLLGDLLFIVSDAGVAACLEAKTGTNLWTRRVTGTYSSSPVVADGHLYLFDQNSGKGHVLTADREGKVVATNLLDAGVRATPAIVDKALFVRTYTHLYRIEKK